MIEKQTSQILELRKMQAATQDVGKEIERSLGRKARKVLEDLKTPFDKYVDKRKQLQQLEKAGLINTKQYYAALKQAKDHYAPMTEAAKRAAEENKRAAEEVKRLGDKARSIYEVAKTSQQKYNDEIEVLVKAYKKGKLTLDQYNQAVDHTATKYKKAGESGDHAFGRGMLGYVNQMTAALGIGGGLAGAVALVAEQWKNAEKNMVSAFEMQRKFASEEELTGINLGNVAPSEREALTKGIDSLSNDIDVSKLSIHRRLRSALSRRSGDMTVDDVMNAVRSSYQFARYDDEGGSGAAGFASTMMQRGYTSDQAVGLFSAGITQANIDNPRQFAEYFSKSMVRSGQAKLGDNNAVALFGATSTALGDTTGAETSTALGSLYTAVDKYKLPGGKTIPGKNTAERLNWLIQNPQAGAKFADTAPLGQAAPTFKELIAGGKTQKDFMTYAKAIPEKDQLDEYLTKYAKERSNTKAMKSARTGDFLDQRNRGMLEAVPGSLSDLAKYREQFPEIAERSGMIGLDIKARQTWAWMKGNDSDDTADMYRAVRQNFADKAFGYGSQMRPDGTWTKGYGEAARTPLERQQAAGELKEVTKIIEKLDKLGDAIEESNRILERQENLQEQQVTNSTRNPVLDHNDHD